MATHQQKQQTMTAIPIHVRLDSNLNHWFCLLVLFNIIDAITTAQLIQMFGITVEVNLFMRWIIINYGNLGMIGFKLLAIGTLYGLSKLSTSNLTALGLILSTCVYGVLVAHNIVLVSYAVWFV